MQLPLYEEEDQSQVSYWETRPIFVEEEDFKIGSVVAVGGFAEVTAGE